VQAAREAARRAQCINNLKQMALGCMNHERANGFLPTGGWRYLWAGDPDRGFDRRQPGGWIYNIMPYIEQDSLHNMAAGLPLAQKKTALAAMMGIPISVINCPTRRPNITYPGTSPPHNAPGVGMTPHSDYAANGGYLDPYSTPYGWWDVGMGDPSGNGDPTFVDQPGFNPATWWPTKDQYASQTGVICDATVVRFSDITDGTSNTYLVGEKYLNPDRYFDGAEASDNNGIYVGFDWDFQRWTLDAPRQDTPAFTDNNAFGSAHTVGFNMAFCDGSVQSISYSIDPAIHGLLGSRADGQAIDGKKW
jgi:prepilin-type processing-associated H-X9-DG protein